MDYGLEMCEHFVDEADPQATLSVAARAPRQLVLFRGPHSSGDFLNLIFGMANLHGEFRRTNVA